MWCVQGIACFVIVSFHDRVIPMRCFVFVSRIINMLSHRSISITHIVLKWTAPILQWFTLGRAMLHAMIFLFDLLNNSEVYYYNLIFYYFAILLSQQVNRLKLSSCAKNEMTETGGNIFTNLFWRLFCLNFIWLNIELYLFQGFGRRGIYFWA